jgi:hypothetical protein
MRFPLRYREAPPNPSPDGRGALASGLGLGLGRALALADPLPAFDNCGERKRSVTAA